MKGFWSVYRKELYVLFASPVFYVVSFTFLLLAGYFFYSSVAYYNMLGFRASQNPYIAQQLNLVRMVVRPFFLDLSIVLLLISPLLTMRLYAEERKTGTLELLFTYPLADRTGLLAKFAAVASALLIILLGTVPGMALLEYIGDPNWRVILSGYLGIFLLGCAFTSLGIFTSSLTQNQIVAAVLSFGALLMFWVIGWVKSLVGSATGNVIQYLSITNHFNSFTQGLLNSNDILYYLLFIVLFLFLTLRQLESYRWRG